MKRHNNLFEKIVSMDNLVLAEKKARAGKQHQYGARVFDKKPEQNLLCLQEMLTSKRFKTSAYKTFTVHDPKEREIFCLPYFPDRIVHHAVVNVLEEIFVSNFTADTYSCIKGKGIHAFQRNLRKALVDEPGTQYCLKIDVKKFYPSIDHVVLKKQLQRKFKDQDLLDLLYNIIDSAAGVPIGNYLSQYFANFYLSGFDHWIKEKQGVGYYFRYCDDVIILSNSKQHLHELRFNIAEYLANHLNLTIKPNYRVFPVNTGIDVIGYVFFHTHTLLRKQIKQRFAKAMARKNANLLTLAAYWGWAKHADTKNLINKLTAA